MHEPQNYITTVPLHIRDSSSIYGFRRQLKTFLYNLAFNPVLVPHPPTPAPQIRWFSSDIAHSINLLTYLLV